ncbi:MAG: Coq4 family protein [Cyanobium sp.]
MEPGSDGDDRWLHRRVRHTHDLWHVVSGCPPSPAGEAALSAINVMQLRWPGSAMLIGADLMHRCLEGPGGDHPQPQARADAEPESVPVEPDVGLAVAYGLELGAICAPLLAQRWEEGWAQPLAAWRERLGIGAIVARSPFASATSAH